MAVGARIPVQTEREECAGQAGYSDALDSLPNERYRRLLVGLYREHLSMQFMAEEMEVSLPNLYNLHRHALASLKAHMTKPQA